MLKNHENPSMPHFWLKWGALASVVCALSYGSYAFYEKKKSAYQNSINEVIEIDRKTLSQIGSAVKIYAQSGTEPNLQSLGNSKAIISHLKKVGLFKMEPKTLVSQHIEFFENLDFVGYKSNNKDVCSSVNSSSKIEKLSSVKEAYKSESVIKHSNGSFCFQLKPEETEFKYVYALPVFSQSLPGRPNE